MANKLGAVKSENDDLSQLQDFLISEMCQVQGTKVLMKVRKSNMKMLEGPVWNASMYQVVMQK